MHSASPLRGRFLIFAWRHQVNHPLLSAGGGSGTEEGVAARLTEPSSRPPQEGNHYLSRVPLLDLNRARVPDLYFPATVLSLRDDALKKPVIERMILRRHGQVIAARIRRH